MDAPGCDQMRAVILVELLQIRIMLEIIRIQIALLDVYKRQEKYQGFAADTAAALGLLFSSLTGVPVSTTHTKTTAIMGVGAARRLSNVNWGVVREMVMTWILTLSLIHI